MSRSDRRVAIGERILSLSNIGGLDDVENPVYLAFTWIAEDDPLFLCPDDINLLQRYVLALLYFATNGDNWSKCRRDGLAPCNAGNFLSGVHECMWGGITCDRLKRIKKLNLGM